jgi:glycerophosphoryl diester phosphodiesterase
MHDRPLLLGHRGCRSVASVGENTIAAFELALQHGCDGFEFDLRGTYDGHVVACHDPKVGKIKIAAAKRKDLGDVAEFSEICRNFHHRAFLNLELKVSALETTVLSELRHHKIEQDYLVSSFLVDVVMELKARSASVPVGIICERASQLAGWRNLPVDCIVAEKTLINHRLIEDVHATNRKLFAWTVNDKDTMRQLASWQVDGIISDDPKLLCEVLKPEGV